MKPVKKTSAEPGLGLFGATMVGVGAIVGGGILALSGVAFASAGPGVLLAFFGNAVIAAITALSFAELAAAFPVSGGTYIFAKKVLPVGTAFAVGWIVYFASVVAGVLYGLGFAAFSLGLIKSLLPNLAALLDGRLPTTLLAMATTALLAWRLYRFPGGGDSLVNIIKVLVFTAVIGGGVLFFFGPQKIDIVRACRPFLPCGVWGVFTAMGYSFIALQGFDLIASVAGEVRQARSNVPKAMFISLGIAVTIYIPLLLVVLIVGVPPGVPVTVWARIHQETLIADAAARFLGPSGFWLVMVAGVLSMFSALAANLFAASRLAQAMARDRTLPRSWQINDRKTGTPRNAILVTTGISLLILILVGDVSAAGAAASLIFLITFALVHLICILARRRSQSLPGFKVPWHPWLPLAGLLLCSGLALFQGVAVPVAGIITTIWLIGGGFLYAFKLGQNARTFDAAAEAADPELLTLRGRNPLVLVPVANPANAEALAGLASRLATPKSGRVMLLHVVSPQNSSAERALDNLAHVLRHSMAAAMRAGVSAQALATFSDNPWSEIKRVAGLHRCNSLLLGMSRIDEATMSGTLEELFDRLECNVAVLRAPTGWQVEQARHILVPVSLRSRPNALRARLLSHLNRHDRDCLITYLMVIPSTLSPAAQERVRRVNTTNMIDEITGAVLQVVVSDEALPAIITAAAETDMIVLGLEQNKQKRRVISAIPQGVLRGTDKAVLLLGQS
ncbi:MAG: amino acid permease [Deltaproteobacteria bacterium]|nr:amino acid permease [Deltaproteobacteria bacterium]